MPTDQSDPAAAPLTPSHPPPPFRKLRAFAFDPALSTELGMAGLNEVTLKVPWEPLAAGPIGEYLEVVDRDPASGAFYAPVDLNDPSLLAQDGLPPAEGVPQFHQQMAYAVVMRTIATFERALGRPVLWSPRFVRGADREIKERRYVPRLRVYPHALREANAYYSPDKKALLFGYFPASMTSPGRNLPGGLVFSCLSHDVVAHEATHAILDGLHRRYIDDSNPDALAFHEAFADVVALFQHFGFPEAVRHQVARTRGDLGRQNLLGELAQQFGQAIGMHGSLRSAITDAPDPLAYEAAREPHARGAILVAALFDAFLAIYRSRTADLLRIYTGGTGVLPAGDLHPDLVNRLANEASKAAAHVLNMCVRATDYCPPVDVTFGDYLRALVTADENLVPDDDLNYRAAVIEAFRGRGIYPADVRSLSADSLRWRPPNVPVPVDRMPPLELGLPPTRAEAFRRNDANCFRLWKDWLKSGAVSVEAAAGMGLALSADAPQTIDRSRVDGLPKVEVHAVRPARRVGPDGQQVTDLIVEITQRRRGYLDLALQRRADAGDESTQPAEPDFWFRGGCALLVDLVTRRARFCITKSILSENRLQRQRRHLSPSDEDEAEGGGGRALRAMYFGAGGGRTNEPFAMLHRAY
ncbi:MAG: hypothetical protein JWO31_2179 [Phycisphaerales bacterium]|nr:hypothetical protein [Phycisphaerales bacterium]